MLVVQIDIGCVHDAFKVEEHALTLQFLGGCVVQSVVAFSHLLETAAGETALDVGCHIGVVGFLVSRGCHPGLLNLEVVGYIDLSPFTFVVQPELPTEVQTLRHALR